METPKLQGLLRPQKRSEQAVERPSKRPRLDEDAHAAIETRCTDGETALEVDIMILDYAAYQATLACLASRKLQADAQLPISLSHILAMVDSYLSIFKSRHLGYEFDDDLRFRMLLLKLATLFTQRLTRNPTTPSRPVLQQLRETNKTRARDWIATADRIPSGHHSTAVFEPAENFPTPAELDRNRAHVLHCLEIPAEDEAYEDAFYGTSDSVTLLDLLPLFVAVSAARFETVSADLNEKWMQMACAFMLQACLEQYLVVGAQGMDAVDEAFAWGAKTTSAVGDAEIEGAGGKIEQEDEVDEINDMFIDDVYEEEVKGWTEMKRAYLDLLFPPGTQAASSKDTYSVPSSDDGGDTSSRPYPADLVSHLEMLAAKHPIADFEAALLSFLEALSQSLAKPVLVQLESGQLDGMSKKETQEFVKSCGLSTARFFEQPIGFKGPVVE